MISKTLMAAFALTLGLSMVANASMTREQRISQLQTRINAMESVIGQTQVALDTAKYDSGKAFVKVYRNTFKALVYATFAFQSSKGLLADSNWGSNVAQFARENLHVPDSVMNHLTNGNNVVESVAQLGNKVSPSRATFGLLGDTSDRIAQFAARGGLRVAGYSFLAASSVMAAADAIYDSGDSVVLVIDASAMTVLKARVELAHHELGEAVGDLAEAQR